MDSTERVAGDEPVPTMSSLKKWSMDESMQVMTRVATRTTKSVDTRPPFVARNSSPKLLITVVNTLRKSSNYT